MKDEDIVELFFEITRLDKRYVAAHKELYSDSGQYRCLLALLYNGEMEQRRLASALNIRATSLSECVKKLESKELVKRSPSENDKRTFVLSLTDKGLDAAKHCDEMRAKSHGRMLVPLSGPEKEQLAGLFIKIRDGYLKGMDEHEGNE